MEKLYRVVVRKTSHYYVRCTVREMTAWLLMLCDAGHGDEVLATEIKLSDLDEINHIHFC